MTNLSDGAGSTRFSRERIVMAAPLVLGVLSAGVLLVLHALPSLERISELEARTQEVRALHPQLPVMLERLDASTTKLQQARLQQRVLLDLIAGRDRIQTFLALLDQRARSTGVEIQRLEPLNDESAPAEIQSRDSAAAADQENVDPLRQLGYRRTAVALEAVGLYDQLQLFLQEMEQLELVVEASDLSLKAERESKQDGAVIKRPQVIVLSLRFSFYDRLAGTRSSVLPSSVSPPAAPA